MNRYSLIPMAIIALLLVVVAKADELDIRYGVFRTSASPSATTIFRWIQPVGKGVDLWLYDFQPSQRHYMELGLRWHTYRKGSYLSITPGGYLAVDSDRRVWLLALAFCQGRLGRATVTFNPYWYGGITRGSRSYWVLFDNNLTYQIAPPWSAGLFGVWRKEQLIFGPLIQWRVRESLLLEFRYGKIRGVGGTHFRVKTVFRF